MATLQKGDYTFSLEGWRTGNTLQLMQNGRVVARLQPQSHDQATAGPAVLVINCGKGGNAVREIRLPDIDVVLYYAPNTPKHGTAAEEREVAQLLPITAIDTTH
jgi:hypothetical protein